jgi:hypothetical protein
MAATATDISGPAGVLLAVIDRPLWLRLFVNDRLPTPTDTVDAYEEARFPGYQPIVLMRDAWTVRLGTPPTADASRQTFWRTQEGEPVDVYGYYLTDADGALRAPAARFAEGPETMEFQNDRLLIEPTLEGAQVV